MYKRILVPVDGSATSNRGLREAILLAKDQQAKLRLIHVVEEYWTMVGASSVLAGFGEAIDVLRQNGKEVLAAATTSAKQQGAEVESSFMQENWSGRVADIIVEQAREWHSDLIVMGTHGRRGASHLVFGSDAETVIRTSHVPVMLLRLSPEEQAQAKE